MRHQRYCYWSVATGSYTGLMERCVASARRAGVFKEFHVLTDRPIEACECYDAMEVEKTGGWFQLVYLKAGISKLLFDYFIWLDADSVFVRNPRDVPDCLGRSPIHVPLTTNLSALNVEKPLNGISSNQYVDLMIRAGVTNPVYLSGSAFWIVHRDAIDRVCEMAQQFRATALKDGFTMDVSAGLGYAMQMLCAHPEAHRLAERPDLWADDEQNHFQGRHPENAPWPLRDALSGEIHTVHPAIIHLPHQKPTPVGGNEPATAPSETAELTEERIHVTTNA